MEVGKSEYTVPVLLKNGDNVSTDEILKAGAEKYCHFEVNFPEISKFLLFRNR